VKVGFIGAGNMARAIARGWGEPVLVSDGGSGRAQQLVDELGGAALSNAEVAEQADLVILCHKPYQLGTVAQEIEPHARAVASVLGATKPGDLQQWFPRRPIFPLMPNTAVEVRRGVTIYSPLGEVEPALERDVVARFERLGSVVTLSHAQMGAATAITGVGPAYQALLAEAQVDAAVRHGLPAPVAGRLVAETMAGAAALLEHRRYDTLTVRREVTSPGGSTARGLAALERAGIRGAFQDAIDAVTGWSGT
jgi:pyrroline-5-carboxylate reductase